MISRSNAQLGMSINDLGASACNRDVREHCDRETSTRSAALDRGDHGLGAVDDIVDDVTGFLPAASHLFPILAHSCDHANIAPRGESITWSANDRHPDRGIGVNVPPYFSQFAMDHRIQCVCAAVSLQYDLKDAVGRTT